MGTDQKQQEKSGGELMNRVFHRKSLLNMSLFFFYRIVRFGRKIPRGKRILLTAIIKLSYPSREDKISGRIFIKSLQSLSHLITRSHYSSPRIGGIFSNYYFIISLHNSYAFPTIFIIRIRNRKNQSW